MICMFLLLLSWLCLCAYVYACAHVATHPLFLHCCKNVHRAQVRVKQSEVSTKRPTVETEINRFIIGLVCVQFCACFVGAVLFGVFGSGQVGKSWFMGGSLVTARSTCCARDVPLGFVFPSRLLLCASQLLLKLSLRSFY